MNRGFVKLYRKLADNPLWNQKPFSDGQAWVDLLLIANHKPGIISKRGNRVKVERGQVGVSIKGLSDRWGWSRGKVDRFMIYLEGEHQIEQHKTSITTLITLCNYETYTKSDSRTDSEQTTAEQQADTNKKGKKGKKETKPVSRFAPPSIDEVKAYCLERNNSIDAETFIAHYEANGWMRGKAKIKSWKACIITWEKRNPTPKKQEVPKLTQQQSEEKRIALEYCDKQRRNF